MCSGGAAAANPRTRRGGPAPTTQDHTCWLTTAHRLRDTYGHDVLLMDFYGHGRSPYLANYRHMNIHTSTRQLRLLLEHVRTNEALLCLTSLERARWPPS